MGGSHLVVRMDLDAQVVARIDELYQKRELIAVFGIDMLSDELSLVF